MSLNIKDDTIFIADSHYNINRQELKSLLLDIKSQKLKTSQLFLMGDIFDFLSNEIDYFIEQNQEVINLINQLSKTIEIIYLEGNHDFNLENIFLNTKVISRENQPFICNYKDKKVALAHGDIFTPLSYNIYTKIIRNSFVLNLLNFIDINNWLTIKVNNWLKQKDICNKCNDFKKFAKTRINLYKQYNVELIIEGHFHYGEQEDNYINIPSLACDKKSYSLINNINIPY